MYTEVQNRNSVPWACSPSTVPARLFALAAALLVLQWSSIARGSVTVVGPQNNGCPAAASFISASDQFISDPLANPTIVEETDLYYAYDAQGQIAGTCSYVTAYYYYDDPNPITNPPTNINQTPVPLPWIVQRLLPPGSITSHFGPAPPRPPSTPTDANGTRGFAVPSGGFTISTGSPGYSAQLLAPINQPVYVPFIVLSAAPGDSLSIYGPGGVLSSQALSNLTVGQLYWATLAPQTSDAQTPALITYWLHNAGQGGTSQVYFPDAVNLLFSPQANAGSDQLVNAASTVILDGSSSVDPQGLALSYAWSQLAGPPVVLVSGANPAQVTFTAPSISSTLVLTFQLTVTDSQSLSSTAAVNVTVKGVNQPPVAALSAPSQVAGGGTVTLDASSSYDPNGDALSFVWVQLSGPAVTLNLSNPAAPTFVAPSSSSSQSVSFQVTVSDGQLTSEATAVVQISAVHHAPIANAGPNQTVSFGSHVTLDGSSSTDPDGNPLSYVWTQTSGPSVVLDLTGPARPTFTAPTSAATLGFSLTVRDAFLSSSASTVNVYVTSPTAIPNCRNARPNKTRLWPPNNTFARIKIRGLEADPLFIRRDTEGDNGEGLAASDDDGEDTGTLTVHVTGITQDEPTTGLNSNDLGPDAIVKTTDADGNTRKRDLILLRRQRSSSGDGRIYSIHFSATNTLSGASCAGKVSVCVPLKNRKAGLCVDSGQLFDSTH